MHLFNYTNAIRPWSALSVEEGDGLTAENLRFLRSIGVLPPMAGADDDDPDPDPDPDPDDDPDPDPDPDDDTVTLTKAEAAALRKEAAEARRAKKKAEKEEKDRKEAERRQKGQFEEIIREKDERIAELEGQITKLEGEVTNVRGGQVIGRVAKRLGFEDVDDAEVWFPRYSRDGEEVTNEQDVEAVLKRVLKEKPKLKAKGQPTGGPTGVGPPNGQKFTYDQVKSMSQEQINANWDEVQKVLEAQGSN